MATTSLNHRNFIRRRTRTRRSIAGSVSAPRLTVFRSLRHMYAQIIDDQTGTTLASASDHSLKATGGKTAVAEAVGSKIAELAVAKKISAVRFDRGAYKYHGRVAALADAARKGGLTF